MHTKNRRPRLGVFLGDPAGIGPELVAKLLAHAPIFDAADVVVIGDHSVFRQGLEIAGISMDLRVTREVADLSDNASNPLFLDLPTVDWDRLPVGTESVEAGKSVYQTLCFALDLAAQQTIDGLVYAPLNKKSLSLGGSPFGDELQFFTDRLGYQGYTTELNILDNIWASRVTSHIPVHQISSLITARSVHQAIQLVHRELTDFGKDKPKIAVAALNPHASDGGLFGTEEADEILPGIARARAEGIAADGPIPADTLFLRLEQEGYNAVVSMYHDQGQIAIKLLGFDRGVTLAGGLPIPLTTPAHGTAFDIVGKGVAGVQPMINAFFVASTLAAGKKARRASLHQG